MAGTLATLLIKLNLDSRGVATGARAAERSVSNLSRTTKTLGGAVGTAKGRISGLLGATGLVGLAGGVAGVTATLKESISAAEDWGFAVQKIAKITGMTAEQTSTLSAGMSHFGLATETQTKILGLATKNIGTLALNTKKATKFQKDYGLSLVDVHGKAKSVDEVLLEAADYFNNKNIPATKKAAAMAKLFGKSWQDLLPVLSAGRKGLSDAEAAAGAAGRTLSEDDLKNLTALKNATRDWNDALGGLKIQIGLQLLPVITDLAKAATSFVREHRGDILTWVKNGITFGRQLAGTLKDVAGQALELGKAAMRFWDGLPDGFKDLIIKGIVAQKTVKFMFGIDLAGLVTDAAGGAIKGLAASIFQRGGTPATPLFVADIAGGGAAAATGALGGGLLSKVAVVGAVGIAAASIAALGLTLKGFVEGTAAAQADLQGKADAAAKQTGLAALQHLADTTKYLNDIQGMDRMLLDTFGSKETATGLANLGSAIVNDPTLGSADVAKGIDELKAAQQAAISHGWTDAAAALGADIDKLQIKLTNPAALDQAAAAAAAAAVAKYKMPASMLPPGTVYGPPAPGYGPSGKPIKPGGHGGPPAMQPNIRGASKRDWRNWGIAFAQGLTPQVAKLKAIDTDVLALQADEARNWASGLDKIGDVVDALEQGTNEYLADIKSGVGSVVTAIGRAAAGIEGEIASSDPSGSIVGGLAPYLTAIERAVVNSGGFGGGPGGSGSWDSPGTGDTGTSSSGGPLSAADSSGDASRNAALAPADGGGDTYHIHVGTLVANDAGIDELLRRIDARRRHRTRGGMRLVGNGSTL